MNLARQNEILSNRQMNNIKVTVIGVGGIGSWTAEEIVRMGIPHITLYDHDTVSEVNLPTQNFTKPDIDQPKVLALKKRLQDFSSADVTAISEDFVPGTRPVGIVICAVHDMDTRIAIWNKSIKYNPQVLLYIEARMGAEELRVYTINPTDPDQIARYEENLYPSSQAFRARCAEKAIGYTVHASAAVIGRELKAYLTNEEVKFENILGLKSRMWIVQ